MKPCLLVIDMQEKYLGFSAKSAESMKMAAEYINAALAFFRKKGYPVVNILHEDKEDNFGPGSEGFEAMSDLALLDTDIRIVKHTGSAFIDTGLAEKLKGLSVDACIVTGFCAEYCVLSTYRGAEDLGLHPVILVNGIASYRPENIPFVERISDTISYGALVHLVS